MPRRHDKYRGNAVISTDVGSLNAREEASSCISNCYRRRSKCEVDAAPAQYQMLSAEPRFRHGAPRDHGKPLVLLQRAFSVIEDYAPNGAAIRRTTGRLRPVE